MRTAAVLLTAFAVGVLFAAPVPKEQEKLKPATDEQRAEVKDNLKHIMLAIHNYHDTVGSLPADVIDAKTGKPIVSWRVLLVPYLELGDPNSDDAKAVKELVRSFKFDEPWDSATNKPFSEKVPKVFAPVRAKAKPGETFYRGFGGKGEFAGVFEPGTKLTFAAITDGLSNTIAVIDAGEPVIWTKPGTDLDASDPKKDLPKLGAMIDGDFYCVLCDGAVRTVKRDFDEKTLRAAISRAGGEVFKPRDLFADE